MRVELRLQNHFHSAPKREQHEFSAVGLAYSSMSFNCIHNAYCVNLFRSDWPIFAMLIGETSPSSLSTLRHAHCPTCAQRGCALKECTGISIPDIQQNLCRVAGDRPDDSQGAQDNRLVGPDIPAFEHPLLSSETCTTTDI